MSKSVLKYNGTPVLKDGLRQRLRQVRHLALDLDGTLYLGETLFDFTHGLLDALKEMGVSYTFLTNNSSRSTRQYVSHLRSMGIKADVEMIYSSTHATIDHLRDVYPTLRRLYVLGTPGMQKELTEAGFVVSPMDPQAVVVGFDTGLRYGRLTRAAYWIGRGLPFIATHPDLTCPTDQPLVLPDCGAICQLLTAATGRAPDTVLGKPNVAMFEGMLRRHSLDPCEVAMVGDRLYTDIKMARAAGVLGVLVLTGETTVRAVASASIAPDLILRHAGDLAKLLRVARSKLGTR